MIDINDCNYCPTLEEIGDFVKNPLFTEFCAEIQEKHKAKPQIEYSKCSWEPGWNVKFKKSGKSLCTLYPRELYFTVLVVVGAKEKEAVELLLPDCTAELQEIYHQTEEGNGQRWLMIDLEDAGDMYQDVLRLIEIRRKIKK